MLNVTGEGVSKTTSLVFKKKVTQLKVWRAPADDPCSLKKAPLDFIQPADFFSELRDRKILLQVSESWENLENYLKLLVVCHSILNLKQLHSELCYFSQKLKVRFSHSIFPSYLYFISFPLFYLPLLITSCDNSGSKDHSTRFQKISVQGKALCLLDLLPQPKLLLSDAQ